MQSQKDENENVGITNNIFTYSSSGNIFSLPKEMIAVVEGLEDYIVVQSDNRLLICPKKSEQGIKRFVTDVKVKLGEDLV